MRRWVMVGEGVTMILTTENAACVVLTEKEGALSAVAHNLAIKVTSFSVEYEESSGTVEGTFDANSLRVIGAVNDAGSVDKTILSSKNLAEIESNIVKDVLKTWKHPNVLVKGHFRQNVFDGDVTICGKTLPVSMACAEAEEQHSFEVAIDQREFGVKPYSAMMGMLKVSPVIRVSFSFALTS